MSLTPRDREVILSMGIHKALTAQHLQDLHFPSYQTMQRRIRAELLPSGYISEPFYLSVERTGKRIPVYRLEKKGIRLYEEMSGRKYKLPQWNVKYLPHLLEINRILVATRGLWQEVWVERKKGSVIMDAYCRFKKGVAIEVDLSEREGKEEIQRQHRAYERAYNTDGDPAMVIWFSDRSRVLYEWIKECSCSALQPVFCGRDNKSIERLVSKFYNL